MVNERSYDYIHKYTATTTQVLAKEVFSPQITKFRRERIVPLYKNETWSADLIDKSSSRKNNNFYTFILNVIDTFIKICMSYTPKDKIQLIYI